MATLIQKLFKPKWQHAKANVRLQAIQSLDDQTVLLDLAQHDMEASVQLAALKKLNNVDTLVPFFNHSNVELKETALKQFLRLLLGFENTADQIKAISTLNESERLMQVATYAPDEALRQNALEQIKDEETLYNFIQSSPSAKARQLALQNIVRPEFLDSIQKQFKGKDKTLVRLAKDKRQAQIEQEETIAEQQAQIEKVVEQSQQLASSAFSPTYAAQFAHLKQSWPKLINPNAEQKAAFDKGISQAEAVLADNQAQQAALEAEKLANESGIQAQQTCINALTSALDNIKQTSKADLGHVSELIKVQQHDWLESQKQHKADNAAKSEFEILIKSLFQVENVLQNLENKKDQLSEIKQTCERLEEQGYSRLQSLKKSIEKLQKTLQWPNDLPAPSQLQSLDSQLKSVKQRLEKVKQDEQNQLGKIDALMKSLEENIEAGHVKEAKRLMRSLQDTLNKISDDKARGFQNRKHLLQGQLQELTDWQGFATVPKMEELCVAMEALIDSDKDATILADEINSLQQQWKTLGGVERKASQALWERFREAADKAYEPCRAYFHQQGEERRLNKEKRENLCSQLEAFFAQNDWANADWKALPNLCDQAREEWKNYSPVDRRDHKVLQERFNTIISQIRGKLNEEYERNAQQKQSIIDEVTALISSDDLADAIEQCKSLQTKWKSIPQAGRKDFALWKEFREQCDALFNRRDEEKHQRQAAIDATIKLAENILEQAQASVNSENTTSDKRSALQSAKNDFAELNLPKRVYERIRNGLSDLEKALESQAEAAKQSAQKQLWTNAKAFGEALAKAELTGTAEVDLAEALQTAELPSKARSVLAERLAQLQTDQVAPCDQTALLNLCLELEISMGLESPESEKDQRMALQVSLLQTRMGQGNLPRHKQLETLQLKWLALSGRCEEHVQFNARFFDAVARC